jgi:hypothetical protein
VKAARAWAAAAVILVAQDKYRRDWPSGRRRVRAVQPD